MEDDAEAQPPALGAHPAAAAATEASPRIPYAPVPDYDVSREIAGICNGLQCECVRWQEARGTAMGVRTHAQLRLNRCHVDFDRLKSSNGSGGEEDATRRAKEIRRQMRQMYGARDEDYEDWVVLLSDMDTGAALQLWMAWCACLRA